jgi:hypothetical protein
MKKLIVKKSKIHGKGVFSKELIKKGSLIGQYTGKKTKRDSRYVLWVGEKGSKTWQGYKGNSKLRFLNHSFSPNSIFEGDRWLKAAKTIKPGEEITFSYGEEWEADR